jgi:hypothetical protein
VVTLSGQELHRQLLRLVYRFLFLFTAEDRDLLFPRTLGQEDPRRRIYREGYSVGRLRELAIRRSASEGPYGDLWQTQKLVFLQLRQSSSPLGLPGLGGLFAEPQCLALEECELANRFCCGRSGRSAGSRPETHSPASTTATSTPRSWAVCMRVCWSSIPSWNALAAAGS